MKIAEDTETTKSVDREQVITWYKEQIEVAQLRFNLAELLSRTAQEDAKRTQALAIIAQLSAQRDSKPQASGIDHVVTQEDLDNNPELAAQGFKVGDAITLENEAQLQS